MMRTRETRTAPEDALDFWGFCMERMRIWVRREVKKPRPWTHEPWLHKFRFTNVFHPLRPAVAGVIGVRQSSLPLLPDGACVPVPHGLRALCPRSLQRAVAPDTLGAESSHDRGRRDAMSHIFEAVRFAEERRREAMREAERWRLAREAARRTPPARLRWPRLVAWMARQAGRVLSPALRLQTPAPPVMAAAAEEVLPRRALLP